MMKEVITLFREYMGTGLIVGWFLLSVVYLLIGEKRKPVRILFVYVPIVLLLLYFNPLFAKIVYAVVKDEIYYRILWLIPVTAVIAYSAVLLYGQAKGRVRALILGVAAVMVVLSGSFIYHNKFFHKAENLYHMPQSVVDICDAIEVDGREVMAAFPVELLQYVRQYSPVVCMPYGREITVERWEYSHKLYDLMEAEWIDVEELVPAARESGCHYVVLPAGKKLEGNFLEHEYELFGEIGGYVIYRDTTIYIGL